MQVLKCRSADALLVGCVLFKSMNTWALGKERPRNDQYFELIHAMLDFGTR